MFVRNEIFAVRVLLLTRLISCREPCFCHLRFVKRPRIWLDWLLLDETISRFWLRILLFNFARVDADLVDAPVDLLFFSFTVKDCHILSVSVSRGQCLGHGLFHLFGLAIAIFSLGLSPCVRADGWLVQRGWLCLISWPSWVFKRKLCHLVAELLALSLRVCLNLNFLNFVFTEVFLPVLAQLSMPCTLRRIRMLFRRFWFDVGSSVNFVIYALDVAPKR